MLAERRKRMPATRTLVVENITHKLHAFEASIDDALISAGELTATISYERKRGQLSALVGQDAIALVGQSLASLHAARAQIVQSHVAFDEVRQQLGVQVTAGGSLWKFVKNAVPLRVIRNSADSKVA
jgi:hypothetical protein